MAGQKAKIDKDSNDYLTSKSQPDSERETAYKSQADIEGPQTNDLSKDRNGNGADVFKGKTKKDTTRIADQKSFGTTGIGDTASGLQTMESSSPFANVLRKRFSGLFESENPGVAGAPASSDSPSLGMMAVNNTDFRPPQTDVKGILEGIALQAAETFELMDENSKIPDSIANELQNTAKAIGKIYEFMSQSQDNNGENGEEPPVAKDTGESKPSLSEEKEIPLSHRHKYNVSHYRVLNNGKDVTRHDSYEDANEYSKQYRKKLKSGGYKSNEVTVHAYVKEEVEDLDEKLIGNQKNIDKNHNGKLDSHDFKLLRAKKTMKEATDLVFQELLKGKFDADY